MKTTKIVALALCLLTTLPIWAQQISIPRIDMMPNKPSAYQMLDWKQKAKDYDAYVFDVNKTGPHLPLINIKSSNGVNYSDIQAIGMRTFVGHSDTNAGEAINIMPAVVGASLVGVDKTNNLSTNWVVKLKDFFNKKNGQNVYLNNYSAGTGGDWWYELMPNIYFSQLYNLYPTADADFATQFATVADRQLDVVYKLGGKLYPWTAPNMNYRAFNLMTGEPTAGGVAQPEAAGAIAWILYQAYLELGDEKYREGAELALDFLQTWTKNPSYEIQLPYGILAAARLNAQVGTDYNIEKFMNWAFSSGEGTLRKWGVIVGNWNGYEMSGLIGEAKDAGNDYAFLMNGFQHAGALAPVAKYDKRYAKSLGKWILNLANASRYFYPETMPATNQEAVSLAWSQQNTTNAPIPYESIKENWEGTKPLAMGDALKGGWAATNLSLYSGSSVGYLAALIEKTNVEGVLQIDLNKTDFRGENTYANYLYYNPNAATETINITLPSGSFDIYDAISETVLKTNVSGVSQFTIPSNDVRLLVVYPAGSATETVGNSLKVVNGGVVDHHYQNKYEKAFRIKSFSATKNQIDENESLELNCLTENSTGAVSYKWFVNGTQLASETAAKLNWTSAKGGKYTIKSEATNGALVVTSQEIELVVIGGEYVIPEINSIALSGSDPYAPAGVVDVTATTNAPAATLSWSCDGGTLANTDGLTPKWTLPATDGTYTVTLKIKNELGEATLSKQALVKDAGTGEETYIPLVYYSFNGNTKNGAQDALHATSVDAVSANDARGESNSAYQFATNQQYIVTANDPALNFTNEMTLAFWIKPESLTGEQYVMSHGSWEQRYKISITPEKKIIMTLNTSGGIIDMADEEPLEEGTYYHYTIVYTGSSLEMYRNGALVSSRAHSGTIGKSANDWTFGRKETTIPDYTFKGIIDEVRLYDVAVNPSYVSKLPTLWDMGEGQEGAVIEKLLINDVEWNINDRYVLDCGATEKDLNIKIELPTGVTMNIDNELKVTLDKPTVERIKFTVTSQDGAESKDYTLVLEKRFAFADLVSQKWNKVLTVNNNPLHNGGYSFSKYKWFRNDEFIGERQYYSAGNKESEILDANATYMVEVTTVEGMTLRTCATYPVMETKTISFNVYPNPVQVGETITVETNYDEDTLSDAKIMVYSFSGYLVRELNVSSNTTQFSIATSGNYIVQMIGSKVKHQAKIIVK